MSTFTFELEGFEELDQQLKQLAEGYRADLVMRNTLVKAAKVALVPVYNSVVALAPYDEDRKSDYDSNGTLKPHLRETARIDARIPNEKDKNSYFHEEGDVVIGIVSVKKSAVSLAQEYGTARLAAKSFLRISLERNAQQVTDILKDELSYLIPAYWQKLRRKKIK